MAGLQPRLQARAPALALCSLMCQQRGSSGILCPWQRWRPVSMGALVPCVNGGTGVLCRQQRCRVLAPRCAEHAAGRAQAAVALGALVNFVSGSTCELCLWAPRLLCLCKREGSGCSEAKALVLVAVIALEALVALKPRPWEPGAAAPQSCDALTPQSCDALTPRMEASVFHVVGSRICERSGAGSSILCRPWCESSLSTSAIAMLRSRRRRLLALLALAGVAGACWRLLAFAGVVGVCWRCWRCWRLLALLAFAGVAGACSRVPAGAAAVPTRALHGGKHVSV
eukprot:53602-Chlamydomonas_euryale.AAC.2